MQIEKLIRLIIDNHIAGISSNSKSVKRGFIFVAVRGARVDGSRFIEEALDRGADYVVCSYAVKTSCFKKASFVKVKDTRKALAQLAMHFYKRPSGQVKVIGVTGTNGKTTVTYLLEALLKEANFSSGVIGTINYRFKNKVIPAKNTTPGPLELQSMLADMREENIDYAAMEVSSHALDQDRVRGIDFHSAIFTNLTQDHMDYHKTFENYFKAKSKLFSNMRSQSFVVINNDDMYSDRLKNITPAKIITYGIRNKADVMAKDIQFSASHTRFILSYQRKEEMMTVKLIGSHNIYNILAVIAWGIKEGIGSKIIKTALEKFSFVPGRLERINSPKKFYVFVDYAHTEDALKNVLVTLRLMLPAKIITVFGCGGERDRIKRPKMGKVATELSDFAVITSDNPRSDDPAVIAGDIQKGITRNNYCVILDRREAIKKALTMAQAGDIVLLAGKGHETYQVLKDKVIHFDDREEARRCLKSLN